MKLRISLRASSLAMLLILAIINLAGCGLGQSSTVTDDMKLKVAINSLSSGYLADLVAMDKGYFQAQGLTVYPLPFQTEPSSPQMAEAIHSGAIEVAIGGLLTEAFLVSRVDADVRVIGQLQTGLAGAITVSNKLQEQTGLTESSPLEAKVKALVGKKIGVVSTTGLTGAFVTYLFRRYGLNINKDATLVALGPTEASAVAAMKAGRVDALSFFEPVGETVESQGLGHVWISPLKGDIPELVGELNAVFYAKASLIRAKPNTIKALVRAIAMALTFIQKYPDQAMKILQKYTQVDDKTIAAAKEVLKNAYPTTPVIDKHSYDLATTFDIQAGLISAAPPFESLVDTQTAAQAMQGFTPVV